MTDCGLVVCLLVSVAFLLQALINKSQLESKRCIIKWLREIDKEIEDLKDESA